MTDGNLKWASWVFRAVVVLATILWTLVLVILGFTVYCAMAWLFLQDNALGYRAVFALLPLFVGIVLAFGATGGAYAICDAWFWSFTGAWKGTDEK